MDTLNHNYSNLLDTFPLHVAIWENKPKYLLKHIKQGCDIEKVDIRGHTPLQLAVLLNHFECVNVLLSNGANVVDSLNKDGWSIIHEATSVGNAELLQLLLQHRYYQRYVKEVKSIPAILKAIHEAPDFYFEMKWEFSSIIPLVSKLCPSDTCKIWKSGPNVRIDSTLLDFHEQGMCRGKRSYLFHGTGAEARFIELDHEKKSVITEVFEMGLPMETIELELMKPHPNHVKQRLANPLVTTYLDVDKICFERNKGGIWGWRNERNETINGYECKVYNATNVELITKSRFEHLNSNNDSLNNTNNSRRNSYLGNLTNPKLNGGLNGFCTPSNFANFNNTYCGIASNALVNSLLGFKTVSDSTGDNNTHDILPTNPCPSLSCNNNNSLNGYSEDANNNDNSQTNTTSRHSNLFQHPHTNLTADDKSSTTEKSKFLSARLSLPSKPYKIDKSSGKKGALFASSLRHRTKGQNKVVNPIGNKEKPTTEINKSKNFKASLKAPSEKDETSTTSQHQTNTNKTNIKNTRVDEGTSIESLLNQSTQHSHSDHSNISSLNSTIDSLADELKIELDKSLNGNGDVADKNDPLAFANPINHINLNLNTANNITKLDKEASDFGKIQSGQKIIVHNAETTINRNDHTKTTSSSETGEENDEFLECNSEPFASCDNGITDTTAEENVHVSDVPIIDANANSNSSNPTIYNPYGLTLYDYFYGSQPNAKNSVTSEPLNKKIDIGRSKKEVISKSQKFKATLWLSEDCPLSLQDQILPIIDLMPKSNAHFAKLKEFITLQLPPGFPVKIEIPLFHILNARITFGNICGKDEEVYGVYTINDQETRKCADPKEPPINYGQKTASCIIDSCVFDIPPDYTDRNGSFGSSMQSAPPGMRNLVAKNSLCDFTAAAYKLNNTAGSHRTSSQSATSVLENGNTSTETLNRDDNDAESALIRFAIEQSLIDEGTENDKVTVWEALKKESPPKFVPHKDSSSEICLSSNMPSHVQSSVMSDEQKQLQLALELSQKELEEAKKLEAKQDEELQEILKLSILEK